MTRLRKMMLEELQRRNYSDSTVRIYLATIRDFSRHFGQPPDQLGAEHIRQFQVYLLKESGRVTATLTATNYPRGGVRWVQTDNNFSLQNILIALFRELHFQPDN